MAARGSRVPYYIRQDILFPETFTCRVYDLVDNVKLISYDQRIPHARQAQASYIIWSSLAKIDGF